jgi:hypothetical protein
MSLSFVSVRVQYGSRWFEVNDGLHYKVEGSSFNESSQTYRRTTVESPWIGGRFVTNIVPDTVEETLSVFVYGADQVDLQDSIDKLIEAFSQFSYIMEFASDQNRLQYSCETADYSISRTRELRHNNMALVSLRIPRIPEFDRIVDY